MINKLETSITALCSIIPFIGGPLSVLTSDYFNERKEKRLYEFVESIKKGLDEKADSIFHEYINGDDFIDILENTLRFVIYERQEEKRVAYQNILINSMTIEGTKYDDTEEFQHLVSILKIQHLKILKVFNDVGSMENSTERDSRTIKILSLCINISNIDNVSLILEMISDLETYNLIEGYTQDYGGLNGGGGIFLRSGSGITKKGKRFLEYLIQ